jgi:hypothetical protein
VIRRLQRSERFAQMATRSRESAADMQGRIAAGLTVDDYLAPIEDLPEGVPKDVLRSEYGGTGGRRYREVARDIERRLDGCSLLAPR